MEKKYKYKTGLMACHSSKISEAAKETYIEMFNIPGEWEGLLFFHNKRLTRAQIAEIKGFLKGLSFAGFDM